MNRSTPGLPVHHQLPEFTQTQRPSCQGCHPAISSLNMLLYFCPQSFPSSRSFPMSQLFTSGDQDTEVSTSTSVLAMSIQGWFTLRLIGFISLPSKGLSEVFSSTMVQTHQFFGAPPSLQSSAHNCTPWLYGFHTSHLLWQYGLLSAMSLIFNALSRFVIVFCQEASDFMATVTICSDFRAQFSSVTQLWLQLSLQLFATPWIAARQASLSITNSQSSLKLMSFESVMPSSHLILCRPLLLLPPSLSASESFPMSQLFTSYGQSIGVSASASVIPMNTQGWSPLEWTGWISLQSKGLSRVFSNTTVQKHQFFGTQLSS